MAISLRSSQAYMSPRQQQNQLSAFVDASQIYSSDKKQFANLREYKGKFH